MFNYLKELDPQWPVAVALGDVGHSRAQNPGTVWTAINAQAWTFLRDNIAGSHPQRTVVAARDGAGADDIGGGNGKNTDAAA